ncbi:hypothetical protein FQN54_000880 [Arachnomyces sp. PD_36]|nr:hypothetical protein FQN54_000880 [Arachnomyces sp. PD_36]
MEISQLYIYPIKGLRPTSVPSSTLTPHGFPHDRLFMLHRIYPDGTKKKTVNVPYFPITSRFLTDIVFPDDDGKGGKIIVTFHPPPGEDGESRGEARTLEVPLEPDVAGLETVDIDLQESPTKAYHMGEKYDSWFGECFGFEVEFAYIGEGRRRVLGSLNPNAPVGAEGGQKKADGGGGWLSSISSSISNITGGAKPGSQEEGIITFADFASYLVVSETSKDEVSTRLPEGEEMDITKFRPNIVVKGAPEAFEEDFWGELKIGESDDARVALTANCARCISLNVDYETGKFGTGESGSVLKKLMRDRRVDMGEKYSPVFGRYGFLGKSSSGNPGIAVGDKVEVTKRNEERTKLCEFAGFCRIYTDGD